MTEMEHSIIATWLRDIEYKWPVMIRDSEVYCKDGVTIRTIQIFTNHPGPMVGLAGKNVKDIEDRLNKTVSERTQYKIIFTETFDIVYPYKKLPYNEGTWMIESIGKTDTVFKCSCCDKERIQLTNPLPNTPHKHPNLIYPSCPNCNATMRKNLK